MTEPFLTIIDASRLQNVLSTTRVIDCRARLGDLDFGQRAFNDSHIVGAVRGDLDTDFAAQQTQIFDDDLKRSRPVSLAAWRERPWRERLGERFASLLGTQL